MVDVIAELAGKGEKTDGAGREGSERHWMDRVVVLLPKRRSVTNYNDDASDVSENIYMVVRRRSPRYLGNQPTSPPHHAAPPHPSL